MATLDKCLGICLRSCFTAFYASALFINLICQIFILQGLKVLDTSVENFASGAWNALGNAWRGGSDFVHKYDSLLSHLFKMCSFLQLDEKVMSKDGR